VEGAHNRNSLAGLLPLDRNSRKKQTLFFCQPCRPDLEVGSLLCSSTETLFSPHSLIAIHNRIRVVDDVAPDKTGIVW
jgi:hypothetical protein